MPTDELIRYMETTPKSRALWEEACRYLPDGDSRHSIFWKPYPIFTESARGSVVTDADGVERLDFINTMTTMILGHGPAPVLQAARDQMECGLAYNSPNRHQVELASLLCERVPSFDQVRFTNSGTEATLNAIRAARAYTGRSKIAKVEGGYHGTHDAVMVSLRIDPATGGEYDNPTPVASSAGLAEGTLDQAVIIPYNDVDVAHEILNRHGDELAAVIVEPVMGSVGMLPADTAYLQMLRDFADASGALLIFDEVISFRVLPGGAQQHYGITPDMTALGKIIGGGFPVGAFGGRSDIMSLYSPLSGPVINHGGTFNANPVTMAGRRRYPDRAHADGVPASGGADRDAAPGRAASLLRVGAAGSGNRAGIAVWHPLHRPTAPQLPGHRRLRQSIGRAGVHGDAQRGFPAGAQPGRRHVHRARRG